jgi:N-formylglutamate amidohydrolase
MVQLFRNTEAREEEQLVDCHAMKHNYEVNWSGQASDLELRSESVQQLTAAVSKERKQQAARQIADRAASNK